MEGELETKANRQASMDSAEAEPAEFDEKHERHNMDHVLGLAVPAGRRYLTLQPGFSKKNRIPVWLLAISNSLYFVTGLAIIALSGWALKHGVDYRELLPHSGIHVMSVCGFALIGLTTLGAYAGLLRSRRGLMWFCVLGLAFMIFQLTSGLVTATWLSGQDADYKNKLKAGMSSGFTPFEAKVDATLNSTYHACCPQLGPDWGNRTECAYLISAQVPLTACADELTFKSDTVDAVVANIVLPVCIAFLCLLGPQMIALSALTWLTCRLLPTTTLVKDDEDPRFDPIRRDKHGFYLEPEPVEFPYVFVLVFPHPHKNPGHRADAPPGNTMSDIVRKLRAAGLKTRLEWSSTHEEVFCRIGCTRARLELEADRVDYQLRLDSRVLREKDVRENLKNRNVSQQATLESIPDDAASVYSPYDYIYGKYEIDAEVEVPGEPDRRMGTSTMFSAAQPPKRTLYRHDRRTRSKFRSIDVLKLVISIVRGPLNEAPVGAGLALDQLNEQGYIIEYFPLHDRVELESLFQRWYKWFNGVWDQPLARIQAYFGEKVALYAAFTGHFTMWLLCPSLFGAGVYTHQLASGTFSASSVPYFAVFIAAWSTLMLEFWKRQQKYHALEWGMSNYEKNESARPQFVAHPQVKQIPSMVTGLPVNHFPARLKNRKKAMSWATIAAMVCIVLIAVFSILVLRAFLVTFEESGLLPEGSGVKIASALNALQIIVLNKLYGKVAKYLNDQENHSTDTMYEDALIAKVFCFQFVNSYFSLFYIAFAKDNIELFGRQQSCLENDMGQPDCMAELANQLGVIFISRLVVGNIQEVVVPLLKIWWDDRKDREKREALGISMKKESPAEVEFDMEDYDTLSDYSEQVIQFGYVSLFVVAFPLAPLLAFVSNYIELRVDCYKLYATATRPLPAGAQDIGTWYKWLDLMGHFCVITNLAVAIFSTTTNTFVFTFAEEHPVWTFLLLEHLVFGMKYALDWLLPDTAGPVQLQLQRQRYLVAKHLNNVQDEVVDFGNEDNVVDDTGALEPIEYSAMAGAQWHSSATETPSAVKLGFAAAPEELHDDYLGDVIKRRRIKLPPIDRDSLTRR